jgi:dihydrofolate reductase
MRTIRIAEHISLDGVIQPGGPDEDSEYAHGGWTAPYRTPEGAAALAGAYGKDFDLLLGRRTYDLWASFWPKMSGGPFADGLNAATKYVATHRPDSLEWGPVGDLGADVMEGVRRLRSLDGPDLMVCGSASLTSVLLEQGLVDEIVLAVYPILLGRGKRCFPDRADAREFTLVSSMATPTGVLLNSYRRDGSTRTRSSADASG